MQIIVYKFEKIEFSLDDKKTEWNSRYKILDLKKYRSLRLFAHYKKWIDEALELLKKKGIKSPICIELACGSAPFSEYLKKKGFRTISSDYSEVVVEKLKFEGFESYVSDISSLKELSKFFHLADLVIVSGGIYENSQKDFDKKTFSSIKKIMSEKGLYLQIYNVYLTFPNFIKAFIQSYISYFNIKNWNFLRIFLNKKKLKRTTLYVLYSKKNQLIKAKSLGLKIEKSFKFKGNLGLIFSKEKK